MDKAGLSSNWKKLQATLKKDTSTAKRKSSDHDGDATVKKRKTEKPKTKTTITTRDKPTLKRKRMSERTELATHSRIQASPTRRKSSAGVPAETKISSRAAKENEGRSPT
jgi:RNA exonuclease 4